MCTFFSERKLSNDHPIWFVVLLILIVVPVSFFPKKNISLGPDFRELAHQKIVAQKKVFSPN